jgi:hypothetical protein
MQIVEGEAVTYEGLLMKLADCDHRSWEAEAMAIKAEADGTALDTIIAKAGVDPVELVTAARELALKTYKPAQA